MKMMLAILLLSCLLLTGAVWADTPSTQEWKQWINQSGTKSSGKLSIRDAIAVDPVGGFYGPYPNMRKTVATFSPISLIPNPIKGDVWVKADSTQKGISAGIRWQIPWPGEQPQWDLKPTMTHSLDVLKTQTYVPEKTSLVHSGAATTVLAVDMIGKGPASLPKIVTGFGVNQIVAEHRYGVGNALATGSSNWVRDIGKYTANSLGLPLGAGKLNLSLPSFSGIGKNGIHSYSSSLPFSRFSSQSWNKPFTSSGSGLGSSSRFNLGSSFNKTSSFSKIGSSFSSFPK